MELSVVVFQPLTEREYNGLKVGDPLSYHGGRGEYAVQAHVTVASRPSTGCLVRIYALDSVGSGQDRRQYLPGTEIVAGQTELFRLPQLPIEEQAIQFALRQLVERREQNKDSPKVHNAQLKAGEPMTFYCVSCGAIADIKPELYISLSINSAVNAKDFEMRVD